MKKKQKKSKKKTKTKKKNKAKRAKRKINKIKKSSKKQRKNKLNKKKKKNKSKKPKKVNYQPKIKKKQKDSLVLKLVKFQLSLKPQFNFKFNFGLEKSIQSFFDKISEVISDYKILKIDEKRRIKIEKIESLVKFFHQVICLSHVKYRFKLYSKLIISNQKLK